MSIDRETILKVAKLARLHLSEAEIETMKTDLNKILDYVDQLNSVNTEGVKPLVSVLDVDTVMRPDVPEPSLSQEEALRNAPDKNSDYFKVPKVLGQ
ncbi:MAG: Asp-tRNA(Asn)/Glu-tRNA(Gln) amidotransferase subunit GatC [Calditrichaeota bacterium]|nr:Asp-tRNA(Asn)/Glu-tRNA(Gln) amidotransferase subunit GatC [Calditrichota bacterium]